MSVSKAHIIAQLQKEILSLQGYKTHSDGQLSDAGLGRIKYAFPNATFPVGAVHEFFCTGQEDASATIGFISGIISSLHQHSGVLLWISATQSIFPPALRGFGIQPHEIIFVHVPQEKERLWTIEEALKCDGISAVVAEIRDLSFTAGRRLQLAVEKSKVTGFIIRLNPKNLATACETRWKITPLPTATMNELPGLGFPRWNVELLKVRNGKPGTWIVEWAGDYFKHVYKIASIEKVSHRKAG